MASPPNPPPPSATSKPPKPTTSSAPENPPAEDDRHLDTATHLTRREVLRRRMKRCEELLKCYRAYYWAMMEDLRVKHREFMWNYGVSPFKEDNVQDGTENANANGNGGDDEMEESENVRCAFVGCKLKAMALSRFCHLHILSDSDQKLYKPCEYVIKSSQAGPITCNKPILCAMVPSLCSLHFQKAQKHMTRALKKAGLNISSSSKFAPKFHVIVAEFVRQIQAKRRAARKYAVAGAGTSAGAGAGAGKIVCKEEGES